MSFAKAKIVVRKEDGPLPGPDGPKTEFDVRFNPTEYTLQKGVQIAEIPIYGIDSPILQYVRGQNERLTLELFFDTTERGIGDSVKDVRKLTHYVYQLVKNQRETHACPRFTFHWGGLEFPAIAESVQQRFTLFNPAGIPLRATVSLTMREYKSLQKQLQAMGLRSADYTKLYVVRRGDTLITIAAHEYGDTTAWRHIAEANNINNPRQLTPGQRLEIPSLT